MPDENYKYKWPLILIPDKNEKKIIAPHARWTFKKNDLPDKNLKKASQAVWKLKKKTWLSCYMKIKKHGSH